MSVGLVRLSNASGCCSSCCKPISLLAAAMQGVKNTSVSIKSMVVGLGVGGGGVLGVGLGGAAGALFSVFTPTYPLQFCVLVGSAIGGLAGVALGAGYSMDLVGCTSRRDGNGNANVDVEEGEDGDAQVFAIYNPDSYGDDGD